MGEGTLKPAALKLALDLVKDHLGEMPHLVATSLVDDGRQSLQDLGRSTGLTPTQTKDALLAMMQQNCVASWRQPPPEGTRLPPQQVYELLPHRILHRMRHPRRASPFHLPCSSPPLWFLLYARQTFGEESEALLEGLLEHGRLRLSQLIARAAARAGRNADEVQDVLQSAFVELVDARLVERVPSGCIYRPSELQIVPPVLVTTRGRGATRGATAQNENVAMEVAAQRAREELERFRLPPVLQAWVQQRAALAALGEEGRPAKVRRTDGAGEAPSPSAQPAMDDDKILWRANYEEFHRRFRHRACSALVREKVDDDASAVLAAMLALSRPHEAKLREERSPPLPEAEIVAAVAEMGAQAQSQADAAAGAGPGADAGPTLDGPLPPDPAHVPGILRRLAADTSELITCVGEGHGGPAYCVNTKRIIDLIRMKEVEGVVKERWGGPACRIFRLLLVKRQLEQKQIAEMAMLPMKDTRELLYKLLKANYLQLQEVARTAERVPSRTFYLFRVDLARVIECVGTELYRTAAKARLRLLFELEQEKEVLELLEAVARAAGADGQATAAPALTAGQRQRLERIRHVAATLETCIMRLDELILIFNVV